MGFGCSQYSLNLFADGTNMYGSRGGKFEGIGLVKGVENS